jgi:hypothetical protein
MVHCPTAYGSPSGHALLWLLFVWPIAEHLIGQVVKNRCQYLRTNEPTHLAISGDILEHGTHSTAGRPRSLRGAIECCSSPKLWLDVARLVLVLSLVVCYVLMLFSRLALGTHLPYDLLYGMGAGALILTVVSTHNVRVLSRRFAQAPRGTCCVNLAALFRLALLALTLVGIVEGVAWGFHDGAHVLPDPRQWAKLAERSCG